MKIISVGRVFKNGPKFKITAEEIVTNVLRDLIPEYDYWNAPSGEN